MITSHAPLQWLHSMRETNPWLTHWYLALQPFHFTIHYRKGCLHANTDFLSQQAVNTYLDEQAGGTGGGCVVYRRTPHLERRAEVPPGGLPPQLGNQQMLWHHQHNHLIHLGKGGAGHCSIS